MTTSLYLHEFKNNINRIVLDKNVNPDSQEVKIKLQNIFNAFKEETEQLSYGKELLTEGESFFNRIYDNLDKISKLRKKTSPISANQKV